GMHGNEQVFAVVIERAVEPLEQGFQRGQQQRQGRAQFVADVGKKAAFDFVELLQLLVGFLEDDFVFLQFILERELAKTEAVKNQIANDHDDAGEGEEIDIVDEDVPMLNIHFLGRVAD